MYPSNLGSKSERTGLRDSIARGHLYLNRVGLGANSNRCHWQREFTTRSEWCLCNSESRKGHTGDTQFLICFLFCPLVRSIISLVFEKFTHFSVRSNRPQQLPSTNWRLAYSLQLFYKQFQQKMAAKISAKLFRLKVVQGFFIWIF